MRSGKHRAWRKYAGILLLCFLSLGAIGVSSPGRRAANSARNFVCYYHALERSGLAGGFWERLLFSLVLASTHSPPANENSAAAKSTSSS